MRCACDSLYVLHGNEAVAYAREHLLKLATDGANWTISYRCPDTGREWLRDYPDSEWHGGGPPRLRQLDDDGHPIERPSVDPHR